jgi:D-beta-D-heptose 7-phosphate kinase/D-beta-D-heptose 1-phosphate adenosyltransferase
MDRLTTGRVDALLEAMRHVRVLVVGDVMLDRYLHGPASRISPEAPVPVVRVTGQWRALGGAANVAANVVALGARCAIAGCVGDDEGGLELGAALAEAGIDSAGLVTVPGRPTTVKTRVMSRHHQVARYDMEVDEDLDAANAERLAARVRGLLEAADVVILEDYDKGALVPAVIRAALDSGGRAVVVDPKARNFFAYAGATVFKPNLAELEAAAQSPVRADDAAWMRGMRERLRCEHLLVTLGEHGMALLTAGGEHVRVPAVARSVYDVSGAGDTVTATVAVALAAGASVAEAALLANQAAAIEVGKLGVAVVTPAEIRAAVAERSRGRGGNGS